MPISDLPDRPLVVKCTFDYSNKKITFSSARNCSFPVLKERVEKCFSLRSSIISWRDDDGVTTPIDGDQELAEAIEYFCSGDDAPLSSAASILSGRSFGSKKITLRVSITVDYDGSLSDTSSLASLEEFRSRNGSKHSFALSPRSFELEDDAVTVSSRDRMGPTSRPSQHLLNAQSPGQKSSPTVQYQKKVDETSDWELSLSTESSRAPTSSNDRSLNGVDGRSELASAMDRYPADPEAVFARLKLQEEFGDGDSDWDSMEGEDRGAQWLREQKERAIRSRIGVLPEPSIADSDSFDDLSGDLSLERNNSGRYYYTYNASASGSAPTHISTEDDAFQAASEADEILPFTNGKAPAKPRPNSRHLHWLVEQQLGTEENRKLQSTASHSSLPKLKESSTPNISPYMDEYMLYAHLTSPPPEILTDCSMCGTLLDSFRYICSICGEKPPIGSGQHTHNDRSLFIYPPQPLGSSPQSPSSQVYIGSAETLHTVSTARGGPVYTVSGSSSAFSSRPHLHMPTRGYELCMGCFQEGGIQHAIEAALSSPSPVSPRLSRPVADLSAWRRSAPKKGQIRHAFKERFWGDFGWEDIAVDESTVSTCKTCGAHTTRQRYKCAACADFHLCRACYSLVHDIHPNDAFILVPDAPTRPNEFDGVPGISADSTEEQSLDHQVSCAHCLLPIVGARFHCAICDTVDICSNCEAAGLPGNLDSADGGHNSSHILIKIPFPLENRELENASKRALHLWQGRDAAVAFSVSRFSSQAETAYAHTVVGGLSAHEPLQDHGISCNGCKQSIRGVRYQCAHCPSRPSSYNLCSNCDGKSWAVHDPMHIFFKVPRPIDVRSLESPSPFLPPLYQVPAGPINPGRVDDPRAYLKDLVHTIAVCDRCMEHIHGEWFRCANCSLDLCEHCESVDTHADDHIFIVIKSTIDLSAFKVFTNPENPIAIISSSVY